MSQGILFSAELLERLLSFSNHPKNSIPVVLCLKKLREDPAEFPMKLC